MLVQEQEYICCRLKDLPKAFHNRYTEEAHRALLELLFRSLVGRRDDYLPLLFPQGPPSSSETWSLREAQGAVEGAEYTEAARGHPCGHIFKNGEATYRCKTCTVDDTCVLCAKCFDNSDHEGHTVFVAVSPGNSGCCDCGDLEAFIRPVHCNIHSLEAAPASKAAGKAKAGAPLPQDLLDSVRMTIARVLDYFCDVFSCSPEQLRLPKTEESIRKDERSSRLNSKWYGGSEEEEADQEFALVLWNDEKHTVEDVKQQVSRACKQSQQFGWAKSVEVDDVGRSVVAFNTDLSVLLRMAKVIEEIKLTVTIRSARDTFREQMCATIVEWIHDIAGCSIGSDGSILRNVICEEMLKAWRVGSEAHHLNIGSEGLDDHECEDFQEELILGRIATAPRRRTRTTRPAAAPIAHAPDFDDEEEDEEDEDADNEWDEEERIEEEDEEMEIDLTAGDDGDADVEMEVSDAPDDELETGEATFAGIPPPPPPPPAPRQRGHTQPQAASARQLSLITSGPTITQSRRLSVPQSGTLEPQSSTLEIPPTPRVKVKSPKIPRSPRYWLEKPEGYQMGNVPLHEDLWQRVRLDYMILYDLRMWKKVRVDLRDVFISTVVTIPYFKRILGLRFAGLYTALAQLYLIADREPDHSIINLSLQMLTTPSITAEVVERGNFLANLMAILYTFLTTRQVGYPWNVNPLATLAFEAGAVTNRRMYHFFLDMKYLLGSEFVKEKLAAEERYLLQFLDLVKLHQGICPNVRAVGEHIEYETDAWISASLITREINKLCRQFSEAFSMTTEQDDINICRAIRNAAKVVIIHSLGAERRRFEQAEIQQETRFKFLPDFESKELSTAPAIGQHPKIVDFEVAKEPMSFHHALHYTLSWLIDRGKIMPRDKLHHLLSFTAQQLKEAPVPVRAIIPDHAPDEYLLALFDYPLRVCAWLTQMRAGIWVRNGITLRHQMSTYRGVLQRDVSFQRDLFLLQTALVICPTTQFLAQMVDRFSMLRWAQGDFTFGPGFEDHQVIDVAEDFIHLLIILLGDRTALLTTDDDSDPQILAMRRDIVHILCFKPLSHSDLTNRLPDKTQDHDDFADVLGEMTKFRPPEGLADSGTFELKEQYLEDIDPYIAQYNRNQREEAETIYKNYMAKKTGKDAADIVFEPKLRMIRSGIFKDLSKFTRAPLFAQIVYYFLGFALVANEKAPSIPLTRIEAYLQFVLQLVLTAVLDDKTSEDDMSDDSSVTFSSHVLLKHFEQSSLKPNTILAVLHQLSGMEAYKSCEPKIRFILHRLQQKRPKDFLAALTALNISPDRVNTRSPATIDLQDRELKKKQALERQARVMAQFKEQQSTFMASQAIDWGDEDFSDLDDDIQTPVTEQEKLWKYPSGTCILCQEETNDQKIFGTFSFISDSSILRQTPVADPDWIDEILETPRSLDRSAEDVRPFGVASKNRRMVSKVTSDKRMTVIERQELGKGFPQGCARRGPVATGCGHIMHYSCFEVYINATIRRHGNQIARAHPERPEFKEFLCPLCKALGNTFLPIIWKGKIESYPGVLDTPSSFDDWLGTELVVHMSKIDKTPERTPSETPSTYSRQQKMFLEYGTQEMIPLLSSKLPDISRRSFSLPPPIPTFSGPPEDIRRAIPHHLFNPIMDSGIANSEGGATPIQTMPILELARIYQRIRDTMKVNGLNSRYSHPMPSSSLSITEDLTCTDTLARTLGHSISAIEITQRGVESDVGMTLLDKVSSQSLTHLRVLSETVSSYIAIGGLRNEGLTKTNQEFSEMQIMQFRQLFIGHPRLFEQNSLNIDLKSLEPLLSQDAFIFLTECSVFMVPSLQMDIHHVLRLCYFAEIIRVIVALTSDDGGLASLIAQHAEARYGGAVAPSGEEWTNFEQLVYSTGAFAAEQADYPHEEAIKRTAYMRDGKVAPSLLLLLRNAVSSYALPFLRKAVILMHIRYGIDFPFDISHTQLNELDRLSQVLKIPSIDSIAKSFVSSTQTGHMLRSMASGWIRHWTWAREGKPASGPTITLSHPTILELVGLPKNYDMLTDEAIKRKCATTGKDITDPCLCLFCGQIFCGQAVCCMKDKSRGGCNQHMQSCGINVGLYINIRKCTVLFLHLEHGCFAVAPYLDTYGEVDPSLRRHHQLFLHQKRYDKLLREVWLNHGIPSTIARRLEGEVNNGGWETL